MYHRIHYHVLSRKEAHKAVTLSDQYSLFPATALATSQLVNPALFLFFQPFFSKSLVSLLLFDLLVSNPML